MSKRFPIPTITRRQSSLALSVLVLILGAAYLLSSGPPSSVPKTTAMQEFRNGCMKAARRANGGGDLVMDDATEAKLGAYCGCIADAIEGNIAPDEILKLGTEQESAATHQLLDRINSGCQPKLQQ